MADVADYTHGRVPREIRRAQLTDLAEELFTAHGYSGVSMEALARAAGVTKPVVYEIFGSKDALYRTVVDRTADDLGDQVRAAVATAQDPIGKLRAGTTAFFRFAADHRRAWEVLYSGDGRFADTIAAVRARQAAVVTGLMQEIAGQLGVSIDARQVEGGAHAINGAAEALATWSEPHTDLSPDVLAAWIVDLIGPGLLALITKEQS